MKPLYHPDYPSVTDLRRRAMQKIPKFAFEYLDGGCNEDVNLDKNRSDLQKIELEPHYVVSPKAHDMRTTIFGKTYSMPVGISPIGLQGLMWPNAPEILARAAKKFNVPFVLSTVTTSSMERIGEITEGDYWFQLYHPAKEELKVDLLNRAAASGCEVLVILADVPSFGFRPRDIRNGLAMPPKMSLRNLLQIMKRPEWALKTLINGQPNFANLLPYMPKNLDLKQLGKFMNDTFSGRLSEDRISSIRDQWKGTLVVKGLVSRPDVDKAIALGVDGIIVSNHGGRQLDAGQSSIVPMMNLVKDYQSKLTIMVDSGLRGGPDVARAVAAGADFTFMGRTFMYGVSALGSKGGDQTLGLIQAELLQVMQQLGCERMEDLPNHFIASAP